MRRATRTIVAMSTDLEDAWHDLHDATPDGWYVGRPSHYADRGTWKQHAFDATARAQVGVRSREWTAVAPTELEVVRELARCLRLIREGQGAGVGAPVARRGC